MSGRKRRLPSAAVVWLAGLVLLSGLLAGLGPAWAARAPQPWPLAAPDGIAPDERAVWGRLANGLRWVVVPNQTPPGQVSLRLVIEAGSLMERDEQRGLAHFLEHMAFKGSANVQPGEMVKTLGRLGLAFGADTNASTSYDQTIYRLELPKNGPEHLTTGLDMLAEITGRLSIATDQLEPERGVILSEKRVRNSAQSRAGEASLAFVMQGTKLPERSPIGIEEVITKAPRELLVDFYQTWYVPGRTIVVVVGDVEPPAIAAMIEARFGAFAGADPDEPEAGRPEPRGLEVRQHVDPGLTSRLTLTKLRPIDERPESLATWRDTVLEQLANIVLDRRLDRLATKADAAFTDASIGSSTWERVTASATLRMTIQPDRAEAALAVAALELARALRFGVRDEELAQARQILLARYEGQLATAPTATSGRIVQNLLGAIRSGTVFTSPETDHRLVAELAGAADAAAVDAAIQRLWGDGRPLIELQAPVALADGEQKLLAAFEQAVTGPLAPPETLPAESFAYADFGPPGTVVKRDTVADLGITSLDFANGVTLDHKPTSFQRDTVSFVVRFGHGRIGLPPDRPGVDLLANWAFREGGLGRQDHASLTRIFAAKRVSWQLRIAEGSLAISADSSRADLEAALRLVTAYVADPGFRPEAMADFRQRLESTYRNLANSPRGPIAIEVERLLHDGDSRFGLPDRALLEARTLDDLKAWLAPQLQSGPLQVSLVGDFDPAEAEALVARTLGALPPRQPLPRLAGEPPRFPSALEPRRFYHDGPKDQAKVLLYWPTVDGRDQGRAAALEVLADIMAIRLVDRVRGVEGATYSPDVGSYASLALPRYGYLGVSLDVAVDKAAPMLALVQDVALDLAERGGVGADELLRALEPRRARARRALESNNFWLNRIMAAMRQNPERLDLARRPEIHLADLDKARLDELARSYLRADRVLPILVLPRG